MASRSRWPDRTVPRSRDSCRCYILPRRAPCRWAATSPCADRVRWRGCRWRSRSRWPDRTVPRSREDAAVVVLPRRAPCRWAATSPCDTRVRWRGCRWRSRSRSLDRTVPRSRERCRWYQSSCDEHLAVGQQRRRVKLACGAEAAGGAPGAGGRIVQLRAREIADAVTSSRDEHLAVGQQRRRVMIACGARLPVAVQVPVAGSYSSALARTPLLSILPPPAPCRWAATSPCDNSVRWSGAGGSSRSRWPDRTVPRSRERRRYNLPRPAPCRWAATSPCDDSVRCSGCRWQSRSRWPDRRVPRSRDSRRY